MKKPKLTALDSARLSKDKKAQNFYDAMQIDVLARTLWGEARGEGAQGMEAVAGTVLNRVKVAEEKGGKFWWGGNIIQVCQKPYQFSAWNRSDPNFKKLQSVDEGDAPFAKALKIAKRAVAGKLDDPTRDATHYHTKSISPYWSKQEKPTTIIGNHIFYRII